MRGCARGVGLRSVLGGGLVGVVGLRLEAVFVVLVAELVDQDDGGDSSRNGSGSDERELLQGLLSSSLFGGGLALVGSHLGLLRLHGLHGTREEGGLLRVGVLGHDWVSSR